MTSNGALNFGFGSTGQLVRSNGTGAAPGYTTATYPSTAGTSGNVLTSDGTNWTSTAPGGGTPFFGYASGQYYFANINQPIDSASSVASAADRTLIVPFIVYESVTFDRVAFRVSTFSGAGTEARLGIYNNSDGFPTTVLATLGTSLTDSNGIKEITISQTLASGAYFVALQTQSNPTLFFYSSSATQSAMLPTGTSYRSSGVIGYYYSGTTYASGLANLTGVAPSVYYNTAPIIQFRVA